MQASFDGTLGVAEGLASAKGPVHLEAADIEPWLMTTGLSFPGMGMIGRKAPLYLGLLLFAIGGVGSALAPSIGWLIGFRFIQGLGACAGMAGLMSNDFHL